MPHKVSAKYIPLFFLFIIVIIGWLGDIFFSEGFLKGYMHEEGHYALYAGIKLLFLIAIFITGYKGLSYLRVAWVKQLWVIWYILVIISSGLRVIVLMIFHRYVPNGLINSLMYFYVIGGTPFPYVAIWLLWMVVNRQHKVQ